jgi:putative oxidoreductase
MALAAGAAEIGGGLLFALGLLTPIAAALLIAVMTTPARACTRQTVCGRAVADTSTTWSSSAAVFAVTAIGAGDWSLDRLLGFDIAGATWVLGALLAGLLAGIGAVAAGRLEARRHVDPAAPAGV